MHKMRTLTTILTLLFFGTGLIVAQSADSTIKVIRTKYNDIRNHLDNYDTTMTAIWDKSTEGGHGIAYYDSNKLKLIEVTWFGETGKRTVEYYFDKGQLIFAFDQDFDYNRPFYWDDKKAKEMGDNEVFDPKKTTIKEDRYYFEHEKLFLWLDNNKKEVDLTQGTNSITGQGLISHAYSMKEKLKK